MACTYVGVYMGGWCVCVCCSERREKGGGREIKRRDGSIVPVGSSRFDVAYLVYNVCLSSIAIVRGD